MGFGRHGGSEADEGFVNGCVFVVVEAHVGCDAGNVAGYSQVAEAHGGVFGWAEEWDVVWWEVSGGYAS